jgi:hypothetical protein
MTRLLDASLITAITFMKGVHALLMYNLKSFITIDQVLTWYYSDYLILLSTCIWHVTVLNTVPWRKI